jgi:hypothetical protein
VHVVGKQSGLVAGTGNGYIAKPRVEQVRVDAGVGIDQDAFRGESLRAVAANGVSVVEMAMFFGIEFDLPAIVEAGRDAAIWDNGIDGGKVAVADAKRLVRSGELDAVADGKFARNFPIHSDAGESAWIVGAQLGALVSFFRPAICGFALDFHCSKIVGAHRPVVVYGFFRSRKCSICTPVECSTSFEPDDRPLPRTGGREALRQFNWNQSDPEVVVESKGGQR